MTTKAQYLKAAKIMHDPDTGWAGCCLALEEVGGDYCDKKFFEYFGIREETDDDWAEYHFGPDQARSGYWWETSHEDIEEARLPRVLALLLMREVS